MTINYKTLDLRELQKLYVRDRFKAEVRLTLVQSDLDEAVAALKGIHESATVEQLKPALEQAEEVYIKITTEVRGGAGSPWENVPAIIGEN
jgi:ribosomal protein S1